jgi:hypothetical protein
MDIPAEGGGAAEAFASAGRDRRRAGEHHAKNETPPERAAPDSPPAAKSEDLSQPEKDDLSMKDRRDRQTGELCLLTHVKPQSKSPPAPPPSSPPKPVIVSPSPSGPRAKPDGEASTPIHPQEIEHRMGYLWERLKSQHRGLDGAGKLVLEHMIGSPRQQDRIRQAIGSHIRIDAIAVKMIEVAREGGNGIDHLKIAIERARAHQAQRKPSGQGRYGLRANREGQS